jgi:hypothetical protein
MPHIETSNPEYLKRISKYQKPTQKELDSEIEYCYYHQPPVKKILFGKYPICPQCRGRKARLPSGKPIR